MKNTTQQKEPSIDDMVRERQNCKHQYVTRTNPYGVVYEQCIGPCMETRQYNENKTKWLQGLGRPVVK